MGGLGWQDGSNAGWQDPPCVESELLSERRVVSPDLSHHGIRGELVRPWAPAAARDAEAHGPPPCRLHWLRGARPLRQLLAKVALGELHCAVRAQRGVHLPVGHATAACASRSCGTCRSTNFFHGTIPPEAGALARLLTFKLGRNALRRLPQRQRAAQAGDPLLQFLQPGGHDTGSRTFTATGFRAASRRRSRRASRAGPSASTSTAWRVPCPPATATCRC